MPIQSLWNKNEFESRQFKKMYFENVECYETPAIYDFLWDIFNNPCNGPYQPQVLCVQLYIFPIGAQICRINGIDSTPWASLVYIWLCRLPMNAEYVHTCKYIVQALTLQVCFDANDSWCFTCICTASILATLIGCGGLVKCCSSWSAIIMSVHLALDSSPLW